MGLGVPASQIPDLKEAIAEDTAEVGKSGLGSRVGAWIAGVTEAGVAAVSGDVLGALIKQHLGLS